MSFAVVAGCSCALFIAKKGQERATKLTQQHMHEWTYHVSERHFPKCLVDVVTEILCFAMLTLKSLWLQWFWVWAQNVPDPIPFEVYLEWSRFLHRFCPLAMRCNQPILGMTFSVGPEPLRARLLNRILVGNKQGGGGNDASPSLSDPPDSLKRCLISGVPDAGTPEIRHSQCLSRSGPLGCRNLTEESFRCPTPCAQQVHTKQLLVMSGGTMTAISEVVDQVNWMECHAMSQEPSVMQQTALGRTSGRKFGGNADWLWAKVSSAWLKS